MAITDFYPGLTSKSRVIVALLTIRELSLEQVKSLTKGDLAEILNRPNCPFDEALRRYITDELLLKKADHERALTTPSGRPYSTRDLELILEKAHTRAGLQYQGRLAFIDQINSGVRIL